MIKQKAAFLKILSIELDDLEQDIELLIREYQQKHDKEEISNYVFHENLALMQRELFGLKGFREQVLSIRPEEDETLEELHMRLEKQMEERVHEKGLPNSILLLVQRKIRKVLDYLGTQGLKT